MKINKSLLSAMLLTGMLTSCGLDMPKETKTSFETMIIKESDIQIPIKFSAKMKGLTDVTITPQVSGQLTKICVQMGEQVKQGQPLFIIDQRNALLEVEAAQANLTAALAAENSAKLEYQSNKNLFEKKIVSRYMLDNSENTYKQAQASVAQAHAAVNRAKVNLGFCTITASVTGVIGEIPVRVGEQVSPGSQLTVLSGNSSMNAIFSLPESIIEEVVQEDASTSDRQKYMDDLPDVSFVMKNGTKYPHKGRITGMTGVVNATTGSLTCKATFPNPDGQLYSGIQGTVVLPWDAKGVIVIPQTAVVRLQDQVQVYKVKDDNTATAVSVTIKDIGNGKDFAVMTGLKVGDKIVTVGANNVQEGQQVVFPEEEKGKSE